MPKEKKPPRESLVSKIGASAVRRLAILILEGRSLMEIARRMRKVFATKGTVAGVKFRNEAELARVGTAYIVKHGPVTRKGRSKPFASQQPSAPLAVPEQQKGKSLPVKKKRIKLVPRPRERPVSAPPQPQPQPPVQVQIDPVLVQIAQALLEWREHSSGFKSPYAYAAKELNRLHRPGEPTVDAEIIMARVRKAGGLEKLFLEQLKVSKDVADYAIRRINNA